MIGRLALLGAVKHYKRSLVVVGAAAAACAVMISVGSLLNGITGSFYDSVIPNSGHVRIDDARTPDALNPLSLDLLIPDAQGQIAAIEALKDPRIVGAEPLLGFGALIVEDTGAEEPRNLPMRGIGVVPGTRFADGARLSTRSGAFLPGGEGIALSEAAARLVGAKLGGGVLVLVQDRSGQPWYERLAVTGIFKTESKDFDETTFYISEEKAAEMLDVAGSAREIRLMLADRDQAEAVAKEIQAAFAGAAAPAASTAAAPAAAPGKLRILPWQTINSSIFAILLFVKILLGVVMGLFAVVAGTIIANTSLMSVMERLREFGTMRAIGLKGRQLERMIVVEGAILGLAGAALGLALGSLVVAYMSRGGIDLGGLMDSIGLSRYNRPRTDFWWYAFCAAAGLAVSVIATARAARTVGSMGVAESLSVAA
jgi:putative ABC transport system permease protein